MVRTRLSGISAWAVGLSTAIAVLATAAAQVLGYLNLRVVATILAAVTVALLGWLAQRVKVANVRRQSWNERNAVLGEALAVWPLRRAGAIADRAFDAGLYPAAPAGTSVARSEVDVSVRPGEIVLIVGPPASGKSELALQLLRDQAPDAWLIVPDGATGLASLLSLDPPFNIASDQPVVLLLDGCERFLPGLRVGALDDLRARCGHLTVVATIRDEELDKLLQLETDTGYVARRLVARAGLVPVTGGERQSAQPDRVQAALMPATGADTRQQENAPLLPKAPPSVGHDWLVRGLAVAALAVVGGFVGVWLAVGLKQPASIATQLTALTNAPDSCGSRTVYAPSVDAISADRPVVMVTRDAGRCHPRRESDALSLFVPSDGQLTQVFTFQPADADGGAYEFRCSGTLPHDPCLTNIVGTSAYAITGAFTNTNTLASYPIEIARAGPGFRAVPLQTASQPGRHRGARMTTLTDGSTSVTVLPTTAFSVLQPLAGQPPVYVAGQLRSGSFDSPRALTISAWSPTVGTAQPSFDHACRPLASGEILEVSFVRGSGDFVTDLSNLLERYWTRVARSDGESCP